VTAQIYRRARRPDRNRPARGCLPGRDNLPERRQPTHRPVALYKALAAAGGCTGSACRRRDPDDHFDRAASLGRHSSAATWRPAVLAPRDAYEKIAPDLLGCSWRSPGSSRRLLRTWRVWSWCWTVVPISLPRVSSHTMLSQRMLPALRGLKVISGYPSGSDLFPAAPSAAGSRSGSRAGRHSHPRGTVAFRRLRAAALVGTFALFSGYWLRVTRISVRLPQLPAFWHGRTIALVSDIHLGNFRGTASSSASSPVSSAAPECILVAGDFFDGVKIDVGTAVGPCRTSPRRQASFRRGKHELRGGSVF